MKTATTNQVKAKAQGSNNNTEPLNIQKRIGSTVYKVSVYFNPDAKETMNDKILRLIENDLNISPENDIIGLPQTGRLPERSSP